MTEKLDFDTYLTINSNKYGIYLFDKKNLKNKYKKELNLKNNFETVDINSLTEFLESNIFKIEKLIGNFIKNIFIVIEDKKIIDLNIGIKKKNYEEKLNYRNLENTILEVKDLFKETYQDQTIMHILIQNYLINGSNYSIFQKDHKTREYGLEIKFISISNNLSNQLEKILKKYQIKINQYLSENYIKNYFKNEKKDFPIMIYNIINGVNDNEVKLVPKNRENIGFFEKFFQLFS